MRSLTRLWLTSGSSGNLTDRDAVAAGDVAHTVGRRAAGEVDAQVELGGVSVRFRQPLIHRTLPRICLFRSDLLARDATK